MSPPSTSTAVDIVIRLQVTGTPSWSEVERWRSALACLGEVMAVQAEDGLWTLGQPEAENDDGPSAHVADIERATVHTVLIAGLNELTKGNGCP